MIDKVLKFIDKYQLSNKTIIVGFSGGYDSMCLLDILIKTVKEYNLKIIAAHYNHNWRGEAAKKEQDNCRHFCEQNNIEFYTETAPNNIKKNETEARELRYEFFERACEKYNADTVFTAHNFDDNAETILYRIIKGTGIVGLKGIQPQRGKYYRPLLEIDRFDIEKYCRENELNPNIDTSNEDIIHKRNLIRHKILPLMENINPDVKKALNNLGKIANSEIDIVDEYMQALNTKLYKNNQIQSEIYKKLPQNVKQKVIYNLIYNSVIDYSFERIENILDFIEKTFEENKPSKMSLALNYWLYVDNNIIEIIKKCEHKKEVIIIDGCGEYKHPNGTIKISKISKYEQPIDETVAYVDLNGINNLIIRNRKDGDIITPLGSTGKMKLKKYLMSKKIPQHRRDNLIVIANENEILWVAGIGLSDKIKTKEKPTHKLEVKYNIGETL